jgi:GntR family transcriptional regulator
MVNIHVVPGSSAPIFKQIAEQITRAIVSGKLAEGDVLPSVRQLARENVINPNTVAKAYADLVEAGLLDSQPGRGFFVAKRRQVFTKAECWRRLDPLVESLISQAMLLDIELDDLIDRIRLHYNQKSSKSPRTNS